jgi:hypothetical protein
MFFSDSYFVVIKSATVDAAVSVVAIVGSVSASAVYVSRM